MWQLGAQASPHVEPAAVPLQGQGDRVLRVFALSGIRRGSRTRSCRIFCSAAVPVRSSHASRPKRRLASGPL
ncbi:hypothetical protein AMK28_25010 [Streptomyces sp. CB02115]|nr:hypothetical protein AMK28_25010 [Streptomyces sp. CB02115]